MNARLKARAEINAARSVEELRERYGPAPLAGVSRNEPSKGVEYER